MSWNGNDLFNSTLMGGMPSGADPHQYLTTDGNGKPHWEDKLAYEASTEEVILPDTVVTDAMYKQTWVPCPNASKVKIGDTGTFYIDGKACPFEAVAGTNNYGPPADVKLYVKNHGLVTQMGYMIGFVGDQLMIYNVWLTDPGQSKTISITKNSTTIKPLDPKYLPSGSGGGFVVHATLIPDPDGGTGTATFDKTFEGTLAALEAGQYVSCHCVLPGLDGITQVLPAYSYDGNMISFMIYAGSVVVQVSMMPTEGVYEFITTT